MASLEQVIRPFQSPQPFGGRRVIATSIKIPEQTAHVTWGSVGTLPVPNETAALGPAPQIGFNTKESDAKKQNEDYKVKKQDEQLIEKSRETERVKITQEDNPDNYVIYERPTKQIFGQKDPVSEPIMMTRKVYNRDGSERSLQTLGIQRPPGADGASRDIPTSTSNNLSDPVEVRNVRIGDRVVTYSPPALGSNETLVPPT